MTMQESIASDIHSVYMPLNANKKLISCMEFFEVSVSHVRRQDFVAVVRSYAGMVFFVSLILSTIVKNK